MLKSEAVGKEVEEPSYPVMKISTNGQIVLFTAPTKGITVFQGNTGHRVGSYSRDWNELVFKPWRGTVTLTQD